MGEEESMEEKRGRGTENLSACVGTVPFSFLHLVIERNPRVENSNENGK